VAIGSIATLVLVCGAVAQLAVGRLVERISAPNLFVAVTAFAMSGDERKALNSGCDAYVAKPISLHKFIEVVERFIGETGGPR